MKMSRKTTVVASLAVSATVLLVSAGVAVGFVAGSQATAGRETTALPQRCNLLFAVGEVPTIADENSIEGRVANPSCSNSMVIRWQEGQRAAGLDDRVCVPVAVDPLTGAPIRCTVPVEVSVERR